MYDNLFKDWTKVNIRKEYYRNRAIKELKRSRKFPAYITYDYKIPTTQNQYVIYFYAENRFCVEKPTFGAFFVLFQDKQRFVIDCIAREYKHTSDMPMTKIPQISAYTSHFFQRYNERFLKNKEMTSNEIACVYLSRNPTLKEFPIEVNEEINRNYQKYGEYGKQAFRVRDGICFTNSTVEGFKNRDGNREKDVIESMCVVYTSFVSKSELSESQQKAIDNGVISGLELLEKELIDATITPQLGI